MNTSTIAAQQRIRSLGAANQRRSTVARYRRRVLARELEVSSLILDPPTDLHGYLTFEVLLWAPRFGRLRLRALNVRALRRGQVNLAAPLGSLTERQRRWLADELAGRH
jgi:hypothetical protein